MYCKKCGVQIEEGKEYCDNCLNNKTINENVVVIEEVTKKEKDPSNVFGILALIFGLMGLLGFLPLIGAILGVVFGHMSKNTEGEELGKAGYITGYVGLSIIGLVILPPLLLVILFVVILIIGYILYVVISIIGSIISIIGSIIYAVIFLILAIMSPAFV